MMTVLVMSGCSRERLGRESASGQLRHVETERANLLRNVLGCRLARGIACECPSLGGEVDADVRNAAQAAECGLDLADAAGAIHAVDPKSEPFAGG